MASAPPLWIPSRGEIIFINHSPARGNEIPDEHPLLVASDKGFNDRTGLVVGFPMTHSQSHADNPLALTVACRRLDMKSNPNVKPSYLLAFQPKSFDWRNRGARPHAWGMGYDLDVDAAFEILDKVCSRQHSYPIAQPDS